MNPAERKRLTWRHYSFIGHCKNVENKMQAMMDAKTTTADSRSIAAEIQYLAGKLALSLKDMKKL